MSRLYRPFMRVACIAAAALAACAQMRAQPPRTFDLNGNLKLVDLPPEATPVEPIVVRLHPKKEGAFDIQADPDPDGTSVMKNVRPGRCSLEVPVRGRILHFTIGSQNLAPDGFHLDSSVADPLQIALSLKISSLFVTVRGLPSEGGGIVALLAPAVALRLSCYSFALRGVKTEYRSIPPGRSRIFIVDSRFVNHVSAYAPRFPDFLENQATEVEVLDEGKTKATAACLNARTVRQAFAQAGPVL
ncbi:MAG: hypothetical protein M1423_01690 [Acidobacteria bacterium]|nr:hypothetical protein [Acidobacteriota bacterium]